MFWSINSLLIESTWVVPTSKSPISQFAFANAFTNELLPTPVLPSTNTFSSSRSLSHASSSEVKSERSTVIGADTDGVPSSAEEREELSAVSSSFARIGRTEKHRARRDGRGHFGSGRINRREPATIHRELDKCAQRQLVAFVIDVDAYGGVRREVSDVSDEGLTMHIEKKCRLISIIVNPLNHTSSAITTLFSPFRMPPRRCHTWVLLVRLEAPTPRTKNATRLA